MTIVTIILIMAAIVAPAAARTYATFRAQELASDLLYMARAARREAMESGRATVVRFIDSADRVEVRRGTNSSCIATNWAVTFAQPCASSADFGDPVAGCVDFLAAADYGTGGHSFEVNAVAGGDFDLCYLPSGEALAAPGDGTVFRRIPGSIAAEMQVERYEGSDRILPDRRLLFPFDSAPRSVR